MRREEFAGFLASGVAIISSAIVATILTRRRLWRKEANASLRDNLHSSSESSFPDDGALYFSLRKEQVDKLREWQLTHKCKFRHPAHPEFRYVGAVGGADKYIFLPTTIGMISEVQCACGAKIDLTGPDDFG